MPKEHRIGDAGGEVRGRRLCGVPSERGKVLPGGFPGLHPGLVCDAPLGHVRGLQNDGHPQSQVSAMGCGWVLLRNPFPAADFFRHDSHAGEAKHGYYVHRIP